VGSIKNSRCFLIGPTIFGLVRPTKPIPGEPTSSPKGRKRAQQVYTSMGQTSLLKNVYTGPKMTIKVQINIPARKGPNNAATLIR